jgi:hypothetical protein
MAEKSKISMAELKSIAAKLADTGYGIIKGRGIMPLVKKRYGGSVKKKTKKKK